MANTGTVRAVTADELNDVFDRISSEGINELVLGRNLYLHLGIKIEQWPELFRGSQVYELRADVGSLAQQIAHLRHLKKMALVDVQLDADDVRVIAEHLGQLTYFDLRENAIGEAGARAIAEYLGQLTYLNIGGNYIGEAGARAIAEHRGQLTSLSIGYNGIGDAGARAIAEHLSHLTYLDICHDSIGEAGARAIAEHLGQLTSLDIGRNTIGKAGVRAIAEHLGQLTSLNIGNSGIGIAGARAIAEHFGQLTSLNIAHNGVHDVGARAIAEHLGQLTSLDIRNNDIGEAGARAIADRLGQLTSLDIWDNNIGEAGARAIAEHLGQLSSLDIGGNGIGDVGAQAIAEHLGQLTSLGISGVGVHEAGARAIAEHLGQLASLGIGYNSIGEAGARAIAEHLGQLTSLNIDWNSIGDVGARAIAEHLGQLNQLWMDNNSLGNSAVAAIATALRQLTILDVSENKQIDDVAPLAKLPALWRLNISATSVSDLSPLAEQVLRGMPVHSEKYGSLPGICVARCPLVRPSPEIVEQGPEAVRNYFHEIGAQGVDWLFEAKVLILGQGGAGKTSLMRRLFQPDLPLPTVDETTRGIEVHRQEFQTENGQTFRLNVWDFGGQQIYYATHQFFLTKSSLYVLVDDTNKDDKSIHDEGFKFWLEVVETLSDASPLLIFQNEKGGRSKKIDEAGIKGRFPNFKETFQGNLNEPGSADKVRKAIQYYVQQLPHIGEEVPAKWVSIRQKLEEEAKQRPFIAQNDYFEIYRRHLEFDRTKALHLSRYLHDLGVFLHFQDDPLLRKTVILQNQWATDAVFRVLDDEVIKRENGRFARADCQRLWTEPHYADMDMELLGLMEKFELCYRLPDEAEPTWLAPQLLTPSKPSQLTGWALPSDLVIRFHYTFLPRGLVSRLMVRQHRFVKQLDWSWAHGAFFEYGDTQVLVEATAKGNEIELRAKGPENKALLSVLASELEALNDTFKGLQGKVQKLVPCICNECRQRTSPEMYNQQELVRRKQLNKATIECRRSFANVSVVELLDGLKMEHPPDWARNASRTDASEKDDNCLTPTVDGRVGSRTNEKTIRIFLASSSELKDDRDAFELYFRQQNDLLRNEGLYLHIIRCDNFLDAMSETRLQDEYNKEIRACDIFLSLFMTKTGKFTAEEFDVAHESFQRQGKPVIYTYFKNFQITSSNLNLPDLQSLQAFKDKLSSLGHFYTPYEGVEHLKRHFLDQLHKLRDDRRL